MIALTYLFNLRCTSVYGKSHNSSINERIFIGLEIRLEHISGNRTRVLLGAESSCGLRVLVNKKYARCKKYRETITDQFVTQLVDNGPKTVSLHLTKLITVNTVNYHGHSRGFDSNTPTLADISRY